MLDPEEFLQVARVLIESAPASPSDASIRRSISTAYYALFHAGLTCAATRFAGSSAVLDPAYALVYRGFDHARMRRVCEEVDRDTMRRRYADRLRRSSVHLDIRKFATIFVELQDQRHTADYDPHAAFLVSDAEDAILSADEGMTALKRMPMADRTDFLALLLTDARG